MEGVDLAAIKTLSEDTRGKIAAGEVVERPVNAVKELLENSIDASASRISVEVEDGGKSLIRVSDDGAGIPSAELPLAVENYSTSKISSIGDLSRAVSLGFRGEALASIRSISRLTIISRYESEDVGREMRWEEGKVVKDSPAVRNPGTEVSASDLFYNLPARRKFLSSGASELRRITGLMQSVALSFPDVGLSLKSGGREVLSYPSSTLEERVEVVFGSGFFPNLRYFEGRSVNAAVRGYVSTPNLTRGNRSMQFVFVNRRSVSDRTVSHAVRQAYHSVIPSSRFPLCVIFIDIPPEEIDVNVHPAKAEIRFSRDRDIHRLVSSSIREALQVKTISFREKVESVYKSIFPGGPSSPAEELQRTEGAGPAGASGAPHASGGERSDWLFQESPQSLFDKSGGDEEIRQSAKLYWQLHQSYIFIQIRGGMVIFDQHAAHERILYNRAKKNISGEKPAVQSLLFPATLELTPEEYEKYERVADLLPALGFEVEPFGLRSIIIRGIPAGVKNWDEGKLLQDILAETGGSDSGMDGLLKSYACRSAVKAGEKLSDEEMVDLTDQLFATEFPFTCPHGRPTMLRVDLADLERRFHRSVSRE